MARSTARRWTLAALALVTLVAALAAACGDDDDDADSDTGTTPAAASTVDPAKAEAIARAALLTEQDLPGTGWKLESTDHFDEDDLSRFAACKAIEQLDDAQDAKAAAERAGRAEKEYERPAASQDGVALTISSRVDVLRSEKVATALVAEGREQLPKLDYAACLEEALTPEFPGARLDVKSVTPGATVPGDGYPVAFEITISIQGQTVQLRLEAYSWRVGNAGMTVQFNGAKADVTPDLVRDVLAKQQAKFEAAAR